MKHLVPAILLAFLMGAASLSAQDLNRDSIPPANTMVAHPDEEPEYPGDYYALNNFIQKNLIYPAEAWRAGEREPGALRFIIRADGVACGLQPSGMHPTLYEEMKRVFSLMPRWIPAKKDGRPVNVNYTIPTAPIHLYDYWDTAMPYHVADAMKKIKRYTDESKDFRQGLNATEAEELREQAEDIVGFTPENVAVASPLARLLAAQGMHQEAIAVADSARVAPIQVRERDLLIVRLDAEGGVFVNDEAVDASALKARVKHFVENPSDDSALPEKHVRRLPLLGRVRVTDTHVISLQYDRRTSYDAYFSVSAQLRRAYYELRDSASRRYFRCPLARATAEQQDVLRACYPQRISETMLP